jgi:hypothetical protein
MHTYALGLQSSIRLTVPVQYYTHIHTYIYTYIHTHQVSNQASGSQSLSTTIPQGLLPAGAQLTLSITLRDTYGNRRELPSPFLNGHVEGLVVKVLAPEYYYDQDAGSVYSRPVTLFADTKLSGTCTSLNECENTFVSTYEVRARAFVCCIYVYVCIYTHTTANVYTETKHLGVVILLNECVTIYGVRTRYVIMC